MEPGAALYLPSGSRHLVVASTSTRLRWQETSDALVHVGYPLGLNKSLLRRNLPRLNANSRIAQLQKA